MSKKVHSSSAVQPLGVGNAGSFAALCENPNVVQAVINSIVQEAKKGKLASYEIPLAIHLEPEPWLPDSGLVTPTLKLKRQALREHYKRVIARLYGQDDIDEDPDGLINDFLEAEAQRDVASTLNDSPRVSHF